MGYGDCLRQSDGDTILNGLIVIRHWLPFSTSVGIIHHLTTAIYARAHVFASAYAALSAGVPTT